MNDNDQNAKKLAALQGQLRQAQGLVKHLEIQRNEALTTNVQKQVVADIQLESTQAAGRNLIAKIQEQEKEIAALRARVAELEPKKEAAAETPAPAPNSHAAEACPQA